MEPQPARTRQPARHRLGECGASSTDGGYDIVHVHTPIAAFVTRYALRDRSAAQRARRHLHRARLPLLRGRLARPATARTRAMERIAAPWTDYLVTINAEDFAAARALGGIDPSACASSPASASTPSAIAPGRRRPRRRRRGRARELGVPDDAFMLTMVAEFGAGEAPRAPLRGARAGRRTRDVVLVLVGDGPLESDAAREGRRARHLRPHPLGGLPPRHPRRARRERRARAVLGARGPQPLRARGDGRRHAGHRHRHPRHRRRRSRPRPAGSSPRTTPPRSPPPSTRPPRDPDEAARRGAAARERAEAEFALPRIIDAYEELYREALASRV